MIKIIITQFIIVLLTSSFYTLNAQGKEEDNIKTLTLWKYQIISGNVESEGIKVSVSVFNQQGKVVDQIAYNPDGSEANRITSQYNEDGKVIEYAIKSSIAELSKRVVIIYNDRKYPAESFVYDLSGRNVLQSEYMYDESGLLTEIVASAADNKASFKVVNTYTGDRKLKNTTIFDNAQNIIGQRGYSYESDGYKVEVVGRYIDVIPLKNEIFDSEGNRTEEVTYNAEGKIVTSTKNIYDKDGKILEKIIESPAANMRSRTKYIYGDDSQLLEQINYNKLDEAVELIRLVREYYK